MSLRMKYVTLEDNPSRFQKSSQLLLCSQRSTLPTDRMSLETNSSGCYLTIKAVLNFPLNA